MVENGTRLTAGLQTEGGLHCRSHSCKQRTKPELGFIHGRRWRTKATAESNDMPRLRMRYAITIAAERETPCAKENKNSQYHKPHHRRSKSGDDYESSWRTHLLADNGRGRCGPCVRQSQCFRQCLLDVAGDLDSQCLGCRDDNTRNRLLHMQAAKAHQGLERDVVCRVL